MSIARRANRLHITGIVQGVGFRPFIYGLAGRYDLKGWVRNTSAGVDILVEGDPANLRSFAGAISSELPPLAYIQDIRVEDSPTDGHTSFEIVSSQPIPGAFQPVSPDVAMCPDCLRELFDPQDRRYRYPFTNCTNCGPRYTIIHSLPYDRPNTTMAPFAMCPDCAREYRDPLDRRFHAQPLACPACGPQLWFESGAQVLAREEEALQAARQFLAAGRIVALKGLGGFHLACDAFDPDAVAELRRRKHRPDKPLAIMFSDLAAVEGHCILSALEREQLASRHSPIVLLGKSPRSGIAPNVAPHQAVWGALLPYTPLHHLLLQPAPGYPQALVMTSGNSDGEPIVTVNQLARTRLAPLADALLLNDRDIHSFCDDSLVRVLTPPGGDPPAGRSARMYPLRRARGYAPLPVTLPWDLPPLLASGGDLKNTFCLARGANAILSQHIGRLDEYETLQAFEVAVTRLQTLFHIRPEALACDLHPDYLSARYARARAARESLPVISVQHHHAHIAACMAEHGLQGADPVIGVAFDGSGCGLDGAVWGGEFLVAGYTSFQRAYHLDYIPLLGGDLAVRQPCRLAFAWLQRLGLEDHPRLPSLSAISRGQARLFSQQLRAGINTPPASSMGRLFDAVASLIGICHTASYEGQAAMELEALVDPSERGVYPLPFQDGIIDPAPLIRAVVADQFSGIAVSRIAARFHNAISQLVLELCRRLRSDHSLSRVVLSGGVWQNAVLLHTALELLTKDAFEVFIHQKVPANDGGLALGQVAVAYHRMKDGVI